MYDYSTGVMHWEYLLAPVGAIVALVLGFRMLRWVWFKYVEGDSHDDDPDFWRAFGRTKLEGGDEASVWELIDEAEKKRQEKKRERQRP